MAKKIYKFPLNLMGDTMLTLPIGYDVLSVGNQGGKLVAWVAVNEEHKKIPVKLVSCMTGHNTPDVKELSSEEICQFVGTVQIGPHVSHVFEIYDFAYEAQKEPRLKETTGI